MLATAQKCHINDDDHQRLLAVFADGIKSNDLQSIYYSSANSKKLSLSENEKTAICDQLSALHSASKLNVRFFIGIIGTWSFANWSTSLHFSSSFFFTPTNYRNSRKISIWLVATNICNVNQPFHRRCWQPSKHLCRKTQPRSRNCITTTLPINMLATPLMTVPKPRLLLESIAFLVLTIHWPSKSKTQQNPPFVCNPDKNANFNQFCIFSELI